MRMGAPLESSSARPAGLDRQRSVQRLDPPSEADEAVAVRVGAALAIVGDHHLEAAVPARDLDLDPGRTGMLRRVGKRLGGDEVGGGLDRGGRPLVEGHRHGRRQRAAVGECLQRGADPAVGEDRGVDATGEIAQLADRLGHARARLGDELLRGFRIGAELLLGHPEAQPERDQPSLCAVVEVALDPA
jgi:hypothetical protein